MTDFDVVVVGAGPAGTAAAIDLREGGATVVVLERRGRGGSKACAGALTAKAVRRLPFALGRVARVEETVVDFRLRGRAIGRAIASEPVATTTVRSEFDALCRREASARGAEIRIGDVRDVRRSDGGVRVRTSDGGELASRFVVAADGASSRIRRLLGGPSQRQALAIEGLVPSHLLPRLDALLFDFAAVPLGYGWAFRKGDHVNVGVYSSDAERPVRREDLAAYARDALGVASLEGVTGQALGVGDPRPWLGTGRVLMAGDAAGASERLLGEGIHNAIASGQAAAAAILKAMGTGRCAAAAYAEAMRDVGDDVELCDRLAAPFYRWPRAAIAPMGLTKVSRGLARGFAAGLPLRSILDAECGKSRLVATAVGLAGLARPAPDRPSERRGR